MSWRFRFFPQCPSAFPACFAACPVSGWDCGRSVIFLRAFVTIRNGMSFETGRETETFGTERPVPAVIRICRIWRNNHEEDKVIEKRW